MPLRNLQGSAVVAIPRRQITVFRLVRDKAGLPEKFTWRMRRLEESAGELLEQF